MKQVSVCINVRSNPEMPSCGVAGGEALAARLEREVEQRGLPICVKRFACLGCCHQGPVVKLSPAGAFFYAVTPDRLDTLLEEVEQFVGRDAESLRTG